MLRLEDGSTHSFLYSSIFLQPQKVPHSELNAGGYILQSKPWRHHTPATLGAAQRSPMPQAPRPVPPGLSALQLVPRQ